MWWSRSVSKCYCCYWFLFHFLFFPTEYIFKQFISEDPKIRIYAGIVNFIYLCPGTIKCYATYPVTTLYFEIVVLIWIWSAPFSLHFTLNYQVICLWNAVSLRWFVLFTCLSFRTALAISVHFYKIDNLITSSQGNVSLATWA